LSYRPGERFILASWRKVRATKSTVLLNGKEVKWSNLTLLTESAAESILP